MENNSKYERTISLMNLYESCFIFICSAQCWLHIGTNDPNEPITLFTAATLNSCIEKHELRKSLYRKSKYNSLILPKEADGFSGYHVRCYKYFTSITQPKKKLSTDLNEATNLVPDGETLFTF